MKIYLCNFKLLLLQVEYYSTMNIWRGTGIPSLVVYLLVLSREVLLGSSFLTNHALTTVQSSQYIRKGLSVVSPVGHHICNNEECSRDETFVSGDQTCIQKKVQNTHKPISSISKSSPLLSPMVMPRRCFLPTLIISSSCILTSTQNKESIAGAAVDQEVCHNGVLAAGEMSHIIIYKKTANTCTFHKSSFSQNIVHLS